jgi:hypothetical protein
MKVKKTKKLEIKKVTLRNLDEPTLDAMAGGTGTDTCPPTLYQDSCKFICTPTVDFCTKADPRG